MVAALALIAGPWTDEVAELAGWDIERFLAIANDTGRAWRDRAVEYPPGSVVVFELLDRLSPSIPEGVVAAHRVLVVLMLAVDLAVARILGRYGLRAAATYLVLGLPLVPMGLLRLDLLATLAAMVAVAVAVAAGNGSRATTGPVNRPDRWSSALAGVLVAVGAMVKLWPALLVPALWAVRRERAAVAGVAAGLVLTLWWLLWADAGLSPVRQVIDLREATGWHVESLGGVATVLADVTGVRSLETGEEIRRELDAFRVGTLNSTMVMVGRILAVGAIAGLAWRARTPREELIVGRTPHEELAVLGAVMTGSVAALLITSPLLSPQFLLWLTPWAALMIIDPGRRGVPTPLVLTAAAATLTGAVLAVFGPPDLGHPVAAFVLAVRNLLLLALPVSCWRWLGRNDRGSSA